MYTCVYVCIFYIIIYSACSITESNITCTVDILHIYLSSKNSYFFYIQVCRLNCVIFFLYSLSRDRLSVNILKFLQYLFIITSLLTGQCTYARTYVRMYVCMQTMQVVLPVTQAPLTTHNSHSCRTAECHSPTLYPKPLAQRTTVHAVPCITLSCYRPTVTVTANSNSVHYPTPQ